MKIIISYIDVSRFTEILLIVDGKTTFSKILRKKEN